MGWAIYPCIRQGHFDHLISPKRLIWENWRWNDCYFALKSWAIHSLRGVFWFGRSWVDHAIDFSDGVNVVAYIPCMISIWFCMDLYGMICQYMACFSHIVHDPCLSMYDIWVVSWCHSEYMVFTVYVNILWLSHIHGMYCMYGMHLLYGMACHVLQVMSCKALHYAALHYLCMYVCIPRKKVGSAIII